MFSRFLWSVFPYSFVLAWNSFIWSTQKRRCREKWYYEIILKFIKIPCICSFLFFLKRNFSWHNCETSTSWSDLIVTQLVFWSRIFLFNICQKMENKQNLVAALSSAALAELHVQSLLHFVRVRGMAHWITKQWQELLSHLAWHDGGREKDQQEKQDNAWTDPAGVQRCYNKGTLFPSLVLVVSSFVLKHKDIHKCPVLAWLLCLPHQGAWIRSERSQVGGVCRPLLAVSWISKRKRENNKK